MKLRNLPLIIVSLTFAVSIGGCGGGLQSIDSFDRLQPISDLPEPTRDHNLTVQINNVADTGTSFKNRAELFINNRRIDFNKEVLGVQKDYHFHLRLRSGVYKIKAIYYANNGKYEKESEISTPDKQVRVYPGRRTVVTINLEKKLNGELRAGKNSFKETTVPISENFPRSSNSSTISDKTIALVINTTPVDAQIFIDDRFVGRTPLTTYVNRYQDHVIKISENRYKSRVFIIKSEELSHKRVYYMSERLSANKATTRGAPIQERPIDEKPGEEALAIQSGCFECHSINDKVIGPPFRYIANRYENDPNAREALAKKVRQGGKGNWAVISKGASMPRHSQSLSDEEIEWLVAWVLRL